MESPSVRTARVARRLAPRPRSSLGELQLCSWQWRRKEKSSICWPLTACPCASFRNPHHHLVRFHTPFLQMKALKLRVLKSLVQRCTPGKYKNLSLWTKCDSNLCIMPHCSVASWSLQISSTGNWQIRNMSLCPYNQNDRKYWSEHKHVNSFCDILTQIYIILPLPQDIGWTWGRNFLVTSCIYSFLHSLNRH